MKARNRARSSSLFLMELIIAILFFSVSSAVCVQLFVKSHNMAEDAQALDRAVSTCSAAAEIIYASDSQDQAVKSIVEAFPSSDMSRDGRIHIALEDCDVVASLKTTDSMLECQLVATGDDREEIYKLPVRHDLKNTSKEAE